MEQLLSSSLDPDNLSHSVYQASGVHSISSLLAYLPTTAEDDRKVEERGDYSSSPVLVLHSFVRSAQPKYKGGLQ